jgi:hypothetical protein
MYWYIRKSTGGVTVRDWGQTGDFAVPGDYDGDGKFDLAIQRPGAGPNDQAYFYILNSHDGPTVVPWGVSRDYAVPGDYDGDGKTDIAVVRDGGTPDSDMLWFIRMSSNGAIRVVEWGVTGDDLLTQNDYDGDGTTDVAVWRSSTGVWYIIQSSNNASVAREWGFSGVFPVQAYDTH